MVRQKASPHVQRLVVWEQVGDSDSKTVHLRCTCRELSQMEDCVEREYVRVSMPPAYWPGGYSIEPPYFTPTTVVAVDYLRVPPGEIVWERGLRVLAVDGPVGHVDELLVDSVDGCITHLVLREGHLWGKKQVMIPVWLIDRIDQDAVYLKLSKRYLGALPTIHAQGESAEKNEAGDHRAVDTRSHFGSRRRSS
ncbi:MAG: PRC-barrel domain-containing protein [Chloroflexi bacterium]|nr:PRC-barrel domain-containing protein [Chloroflexota bacterium]